MSEIQDDKFSGGGTPIAGLINKSQSDNQQQMDPRMMQQQQMDPRMMQQQQPQQQQQQMDPRMMQQQPQQQQQQMDPRMMQQQQMDPRMMQQQMDPRLVGRQVNYNQKLQDPSKVNTSASSKFEEFSKISLTKVIVLLILMILFNSPSVYELERSIISPNTPFGGMFAVGLNAIIVVILFIMFCKFS
jgi:hypothetical protein